MILSHKHRFIFIKTAKTAGTSIEIFLSQHCGNEDVVTPIHPHVEPHFARNHRGLWNPLPELLESHFRCSRSMLHNLVARKKYYNHMPASLVRHRVSKEVWADYFKFCVERNPWDKTLSHYHMVNDRAGGKLTLDDYFQQHNFCVNYHRYTDDDGGLLVDKVIKYESLNEELGLIFRRLGVPFDGSLGVRAKSEHRKDTRPRREVFSEQQKQFIDEIFKWEIQMHGYSF
jgi:hypothetical protein